MMDELKDKLHSEQCSLVVLHEGNIRTFDGLGVRTLYDLMTNEPEVLLDAKLADKAVGRTAARMMAEGGVCEVYADIISEQALSALEDAGIRVTYGNKVSHQDFLNIWKKLGEITD